jgi:hypothetical protein
MTRWAAAGVVLVLAACSSRGSSPVGGNDAALPAPTTADATTTLLATTTTTSTAPRPAGPTKAITIGDSLAYDLAPALQAMLASGGAGFRDQSFPGLGFTVQAPDFAWRTAWAKVLSDNRPDLVLFLVGPWDAHAVTVGGQSLAYGSPAWRAWYDHELDDFVQLVHGVGAHLLWLTAPSYDPASPAALDLGPVNDAFLAVAARWPDVTVADTDAAVDGPDGRFTEYLPGPNGPEQARKADGLHFCPAGAAAVARALVPAIDEWWSFTPAAGWDRGPWRQDDRYVRPIYGAGCAPSP